MTRSRDEFISYVGARQVPLRRLAFTMCGDWHQAEDIVQVAFAKLYVAWPRVRRNGTEDAYVRKVVLNAAIDESRRSWRREVPSDAVTEAVSSPGTAAPDEDLIGALQRLPLKQRQVVVLRHWLDLSVEETAQSLGISEGTVKSHTSRALASLRQHLGDSVDKEQV